MTETLFRGGTALSRRHLLGALGVGVGTAALASCSGGEPESTSVPSKPGKIEGDLTVSVFGTNQDQIESFETLFESYKKQYPDVNLHVRGIAASDWANYFNTISTQIAGGDPPDVVQVATEGMRLFSSKGLVTPLDGYIERDKSEVQEFLDDVSPHFVDQVNTYENSEGKTYYLPGSFNTMCMWCNVSMFKEAGVEEPDNDWTWDDFLSACEKLSKLGGDVLPFGAVNGAAGYFTGIEPWLLSNSANTMNQAWDKAAMNTPEAIEAVSFVRDLVDKGYMPGPGGKADPVALVAQGKSAMVGGGRWPLAPMRDQSRVKDLKIVAWPNNGKKGTPVGWNSYPIMDASENKEAAWALVKFMFSAEAEKEFAKGGGTIVPARKSVAQSDIFTQDAPKGTPELYNSIDYATVIPSPNKNNVVARELTEWLERILTGNVSVEEGCNGLNDAIQAAL